MQRLTLLLALVVAFSASAADEYSPATIVDVSIQQELSSGNPLINSGGISSTNLRVFTIDLDGKRYTATQYSLGGGTIYISNNPAMFAVGSTIDANLGKRSVLNLRTSDGKKVQLSILKVELLQ